MSSEEYKPFVYTPFFRRFTDERARDIAETKALYKSVRAHFFSTPYAAQEAVRDFVLRIAKDLDTPLLVEFCEAMDGILWLEECIFNFPDANVDHLSLKEQVELTRRLRATDHFFAHEKQVIETLQKALTLIFTHIAGLLPKTLSPSPFVIPLAYALPDPKKVIGNVMGELWQDEYVKHALFVNLARQLHLNLCEVSGISNPEDPKKPYLLPHKNPAPVSTIVDEYLKDTPLREFFNVSVPLQLTHEERFSHHWVIGGSGSGKTTLIKNLILHDLASEDRPSIVVIDSQKDLIDSLLHLDLPFDPILISPRDTPALNVFDVKDRGYDEYAKEQVTAGVIQTLEYLFTGFGIELTGKMQSLFRPMCRMMLMLPEAMGRNATIVDIIKFTDKPEDYLKAIQRLPEIQRSFFERDILDPKRNTYKETREQIRYRLQALLDTPALARLFSSTETRLDLFNELNRPEGSLILVDTDKAFLKGSSGHFGQIFVSLLLQSILERAVIPEHKRKDLFVICDEAHEYFEGGDNFDDLLTQARKYRCGLLLSHQQMEQTGPKLRASLAANTAIKMAGGGSSADASAMSREMRCTSDFIIEQPKFHFACHIRNVTPQAVSIPVGAGEFEKHPRRSEKEYDRLIARNRERVAPRRNIDKVDTHLKAAEPETKSTPDDGTSPWKW